MLRLACPASRLEDRPHDGSCLAPESMAVVRFIALLPLLPDRNLTNL